MKVKFRSANQTFELSDSHTRANWKFMAHPGGWWTAKLLGSDGQVLKQHRLMAVQNGKEISWNISGRVFFGERLEVSAGAEAEGRFDDSSLTAQFPGKVRKILVPVGAKVEAGDSIMLLEAMKMEFPITAPAKGVVSNFLVKEQEQIQPGMKLVEFVSE